MATDDGLGVLLQWFGTDRATVAVSRPLRLYVRPPRPT